jgi:hypothetical protein
VQGTYVLTEEGSRAWESPRSGLPAHYRQILGLIRSKTKADEIHLGMPGHSRRQLDYWLDELDTLGFVSLLPIGAEAEPGLTENRQDNILALAVSE